MKGKVSNTRTSPAEEPVVIMKLDRISGIPKIIYGSLDCLGEKQLSIIYKLQQNYRGDKIFASLNNQGGKDLENYLYQWNCSCSKLTGYRLELEEKQGKLGTFTTRYRVLVYAVSEQ